MYYLLLTQRDETRWNTLSPEERDAVLLRLRQDDDFRAAAPIVASGAIDPVTGLVVLRRRNGDFLPFNDVAGPRSHGVHEMTVIEARDLNDAIRVASRHPVATLDERLGWSIQMRRFTRFDSPSRASLARIPPLPIE